MLYLRVKSQDSESERKGKNGKPGKMKNYYSNYFFTMSYKEILPVWQVPTLACTGHLQAS